MDRNLARGLFLAALSLAFGLGSLRYQIGDFARAGAGLFPFMVSCLLFLVAVVTIIRSRFVEKVPLQFNFKNIALISSMVDTTCVTTWPPREATDEAEEASWFAWLAASALWRTVPVSCSIELAVCCRLLAVCSVRAERSALP